MLSDGKFDKKELSLFKTFIEAFSVEVYKIEHGQKDKVLVISTPENVTSQTKGLAE